MVRCSDMISSLRRTDRASSRRHTISDAFVEKPTFYDINGNEKETEFFHDDDSVDDQETFFGCQSSNNTMDRRKIDSAQNLNLLCSSLRNFNEKAAEQIERARAVSPLMRRRSRTVSDLNTMFYQGNKTPPPSLGPISFLKSPRRGSRPATPISRSPGPSSPIRELDSLSPQANSPIASPMNRRKTIDITRSSAYKEIYAENLRLYSVLLSKQVAESGEIGRQMDELRKARSKKTDRSAKIERDPQMKYSRSRSYNSLQLHEWLRDCVRTSSHSNLANLDSSNDEADVGITFKQPMVRSKSLTHITQTYNLRETAEEDEEADVEDESQDQSATAITITEASSEDTSPEAITRSTSDTRLAEAAARRRTLRKRLDSFDNTFDKTQLFLQKVKQGRTKQQ